MTKSQKQFLEETDEQAALFGVLADPTRLKLVRLLCRQQEPDALCVNALASLLGVTQSAVSQHLRVLKAIGLVKGKRRGYYVHYSINRDVVEHCLELIMRALDTQDMVQKEACQNYCPERRERDVSHR